MGWTKIVSAMVWSGYGGMRDEIATVAVRSYFLPAEAAAQAGCLDFSPKGCLSALVTFFVKEKSKKPFKYLCIKINEKIYLIDRHFRFQTRTMNYELNHLIAKEKRATSADFIEPKYDY
ncbi:hypothetical protein ACFLU5_14770 [Bacteroidota bacterium]